jgi:hypothetical protein
VREDAGRSSPASCSLSFLLPHHAERPRVRSVCARGQRWSRSVASSRGHRRLGTSLRFADGGCPPRSPNRDRLCFGATFPSRWTKRPVRSARGRSCPPGACAGSTTSSGRERSHGRGYSYFRAQAARAQRIGPTALNLALQGVFWINHSSTAGAAVARCCWGVRATATRSYPAAVRCACDAQRSLPSSIRLPRDER